VRTSNLNSLKLLLPDKQSDSDSVKFYAENGVGQNLLDVAMLTMTSGFLAHREENHTSSVSVSKETRAVFEYIESVQGRKRELAAAEKVRSMTAVMIEQAKKDVAKEVEIAKKKRVWDTSDANYDFEAQFRNNTGDKVMFDGHLSSSVALPKARKIKPFEVWEDDKEDEEDPVSEEVEEKSDEKSEEKSEEDQIMDEAPPSSLKGMVFALTGTLSESRAKMSKLITSHGGKVAASMTKNVTHLLAADPTEDSAKLNKAREAGVKIVGEKFLSNLK